MVTTRKDNMSGTPPPAPTPSPAPTPLPPPTPSPAPVTSTTPQSQPTKSVGAGVWMTALSIFMGSSYLIMSEYLKSTPEGAKSYQAELEVYKARFTKDVTLGQLEVERIRLEVRRLELQSNCSK